MKLSEKLRNLRIEKGETQEEVANILGIGITTLRNYENDKLYRIPNPYQLKLLKNHYNVTYEYLLEEECENMESQNIEVGRDLGLTDNAIKQIKNIKEHNITNELNRIIEEPSFQGILTSYKHINLLYNCKLETLCFLFNLYSYLNFFLKTNKTEKERKDENILLELFQNKIDKYYEISESKEFDEIEIITINPLEIQKRFDRVKESIKEKNKKEIEKALIDFDNLIEPIYNVFRKEIDYKKFGVQENFSEMIYKIAPTIYDVDTVYYSELKEFYKYKTITFSEKEIKRLEMERNSSNSKLITGQLSI